MFAAYSIRSNSSFDKNIRLFEYGITIELHPPPASNTDTACRKPADELRQAHGLAQMRRSSIHQIPYNPALRHDNRNRVMKSFLVSIFATAIATASATALADTSGDSTAELPCAIGYVTGVGGAARSVHEYFASRFKDQYRYLADNPLQCRVSDEGRASACTGITTFRRERVSVYDVIDNDTIAVVARVDLDHGTYPAIIAVRKQDVQCEK